MIVWASIDESHDQKQADAYAVAALIGTGDDWFEFQRSWDRTLRLNDMTYFKTNEYKKRNGEFAKFKSELEGAQLAQIVWDDFAQIVRTSHLVGIVLGINLRDYHRARAKPKMARILPANPYRYTYQTTFVRTAMFMAEELETSPRVSFLCDEHSQAKDFGGEHAEPSQSQSTRVCLHRLVKLWRR